MKIKRLLTLYVDGIEKSLDISEKLIQVCIEVNKHQKNNVRILREILKEEELETPKKIFTNLYCIKGKF